MKLPVFTAFGAAIAYVTSHFLTLLRIVWLPALLLTGVTFYLMPAAPRRGCPFTFSSAPMRSSC